MNKVSANKGNRGFLAALGLASTWFGLHCGSGFATEAQGVVYFTQYGAWEIVTTFIASLMMLSMLILSGIMQELQRLSHIENYMNQYFILMIKYLQLFMK